MKQIFYKIFDWLIVVIFFGVAAYFFGNNLLDFANRFYRHYFPCQRPIFYELGEFDPRFGISKKSLLAALSTAEQVWEKEVGLNLFEYAPSSSLKINLIYDYRQEATAKLQKLDIVVKDDQATYNKLSASYESLKKSYLADKSNLENLSAELSRRIADYNAKVADFNRGRGKVSSEEAERLRAEELEIRQLEEKLKIRQSAFNKVVGELNFLVDTLNRLAQVLNLSVNKFNTIGGSRGGEFEEGSYVSTPKGEEINIYEFDGSGKLMRLLTHEFGHALGLEHVSSTKAIMYYLNNGINEKLTPDDLVELKQRCRIK